MIERNLEREDNQFLADKINVLRRILRERPAELDFLRAEVQWEAAARQFTKYYARVRDDREETVVETAGMDRLAPPSIFPPPVPPAEPAVEPREWRSPEGQLYLLMSAWAERWEMPAGAGGSFRSPSTSRTKRL